MRELSLHELSGVGGADEPATSGPIDMGLPVVAGFVGAVSNSVGYTLGGRFVGTFGPVGAIRSLHEGWILPLIADLCLKGESLTPRLGRAAFIGVISGLGESISRPNT